VRAYSRIISELSVNQKRLLAACGTWPVLISLLSHENDEVVQDAISTAKRLLAGCRGENYVRFVDENLFDEMAKKVFFIPEQITVEIPFAPGTRCRSEDFSALGRSW
jgi:hypothetical protein